MSDEPTTRRDFLADSAGVLGGSWLRFHLPALTVLAGCSREASRNEAPLEMLTAEEGRTMRAFASRIVPPDGELPGAEEAGTAWFVDRALGSYFPQLLAPVRDGLAELDRRAREADGREFAELALPEQDDVIRAFESTPSFFPTRLLVVLGVFSDARHGGNRGDAGWRIMGFTPEGYLMPPLPVKSSGVLLEKGARALAYTPTRRPWRLRRCRTTADLPAGTADGASPMGASSERSPRRS